MSPDFHRISIGAMKAGNRYYVPGFQTGAPELGKLAQEAGVKKLVLTHLVPPPRNFIVTRAFKKSVGQHYKGELIVGEDQMHLEL